MAQRNQLFSWFRCGTEAHGQNQAASVICKNCEYPIEKIIDQWGHDTSPSGVPLGWHHPHLTNNSDGFFVRTCEDPAGFYDVAEPRIPSPSSPNQFTPLQGIALGCVIGAGLWALIFFVLWRVL